MAHNSFSSVLSNAFTRKWGGTTDAAEPYITGYHFINFTKLPRGLQSFVSGRGGEDDLKSTAEINQFLRAACVSVTLPGGTVNKTEFTGLGGVKWAVPTNVDWDNTVSIRFIEFTSTPVLAIMHGWVKLIRDYRTGVAATTAGSSDRLYAGSFYYWTTKPDGKTIEQFAYLTGVYPMKDPTDQYGADIATYDKLEVDIDFNVDYVWQEPWVRVACITHMRAMRSEGKGAAEEYDR